MLISEIEEKRHSSVIVLENGERLWLTWTQLQEYAPLQAGMEIDAEALKAWLLPRQYPMALNDAVALLAQRAQSSGEIRQKLRRRPYMDDTIEMVLYKLEKERLLDDAAFAREWAAARARGQLGRARIEQELRRKGIDRETAEAALQEVDAEESETAAVALAQKLARRYAREPDPRKAMQKALAAMARRGYGYEESRDALQAALESMEADK